MEVHQFKGDGTKQDMIDKHKLHVSILTSSVATNTDLNDAMVNQEPESFDIQKLLVPSQCNAGDLQIQWRGSGEEAYQLMELEMMSVGCPLPADRAQHSHEVPHRISLYIFGLDQGSDNVGCIRRIRTVIRPAPRVMYTVCWCIFTSFILS